MSKELELLEESYNNLSKACTLLKEKNMYTDEMRQLFIDGVNANWEIRLALKKMEKDASDKKAGKQG